MTAGELRGRRTLLLLLGCMGAACRFDPSGLSASADRRAPAAELGEVGPAPDQPADQAADRPADRPADQLSPDLSPPCGGQRVGGHCFYLGDWGQSCDTACQGHGGCDLAGTRDYAGSAGSDGQCVAALGALGQGATPHQAYSNNPFGCQLCWPNTPYTYWSPGSMPCDGEFQSCVTTCAAAAGACRRVCACNN